MDVREGNRMARGPWQRGVDLGDDGLRVPRRRERTVHRDSQGAESVGVRWRHMDERDIEGQGAAGFEQRWNLRQEDRCVISSSSLYCLPNVRSDEQCVVPEMALQSRRNIRRGPFGMQVHDFNI